MACHTCLGESVLLQQLGCPLHRMLLLRLVASAVQPESQGLLDTAHDALIHFWAVCGCLGLVFDNFSDLLGLLRRSLLCRWLGGTCSLRIGSMKP